MFPEILEFPTNSVERPNQVLSTDYDYYTKAFEQALPDYARQELGYGYVEDHPILFYTPKNPNRANKNLLVTGGYHGEEPGGPWAILRFITDHKALLASANISFLPIVNIWGFMNHKRMSPKGKSMNYLVNEKTDDTFIKDLPKELECLKENINTIAERSTDGVIAMHEDNTSQGFYLYLYGDRANNDRLVKALKKAGTIIFDFKKSGTYSDNGQYELVDGLVDNNYDGTTEYALFKRYGAKRAITCETPAKDANIMDRIQTGAGVIKAFVETLTSTFGRTDLMTLHMSYRITALCR